MAQATNFSVPVVGPASPTTMAQRIDDNFKAIRTGHSGASRPSYAVAGTVWQDTSVANETRFYLYDGADDNLLYTVNTTANTVLFPNAVDLSSEQILTNKILTTPTLTLKQSASPTPTAEGDIQWNTNDNCIVVGDGAGQRIFYPGGWEFLGKITFNGSSGFARWTGLSAYRSLKARGFALPGTDAAIFGFRTSTNNGASYDAGASDYPAQRLYQSGATVNGASGSYDRLPLHLGVSVGNVSTEGIKFHAEFEEFNQASHLRFSAHSFYLDISGAYTQESVISKRESTTARNALEFRVASGVIAAGSISLWGLR